MKLKNEVLKTLRGEPLNFGNGEITLFKAIETALLQTDEKDIEGVKYKNYDLTKRFIDKDEVDVTIEELAKIKQRIDKFLLTEIVGACFDILEK